MFLYFLIIDNQVLSFKIHITFIKSPPLLTSYARNVKSEIIKSNFDKNMNVIAGPVFFNDVPVSPPLDVHGSGRVYSKFNRQGGTAVCTEEHRQPGTYTRLNGCG